MKTAKSFFVFLLLQILLGFQWAAAQEIELKDTVSTVDITSKCAIYPFKEAVSIQKFKAVYQKLNPTDSINKEAENWILFTLTNQNPKKELFYLSSNFADQMNLFDFETEEPIGQTGLPLPIHQLSRGVAIGFIPISLEGGETHQYLLKLKGEYPPNEQVNLKIEPGSHIAQYDRESEISSIAIFAIILSFFIFNFLVFLIFKDKTYLYYLLYLINLGLWMVNLWLAKWLNLSYSTYFIQHYINNVFLIFFNLAYISFALSYFSTDKKSKWYKFLCAYQALYLIPFLLQLAHHKNYYTHSEDTILALLSLGNIISILIFSISNYSKKGRVAVLFLIAEVPLISAGLILGFEFLVSNADNSYKLGPTAFKIGTILEILLFSFALGNRYREQKISLMKQIEENALLKAQRSEEINQLTLAKNIELEQTVKSRTAELEKRNQQLNKLNDEKNKIFSIIGHDLKSPLASLQQILDLYLNRDITHDEFKEMGGILSEKLKGMSNSLQNLVIWGHSQLDGVNTVKSKVDLAFLIHEKAHLLQMAAEGKKIELIIDVPEKTMAYVDVNQTGVVIQNLINNAIKFTRENGKIMIKTEEQSDFVLVYFMDNGTGMSKEIVNKINSNNLVESSPGTSGEVGTGLGLSICKEMLTANNGEIWVESIPNKGTNIQIKLPKS
ncbi:MAG: sensor histidine kinase [Sphingobacteriales bacterium]|nr:sensor histidine kinase [Sphingobacteriales bacterium]